MKAANTVRVRIMGNEVCIMGAGHQGISMAAHLALCGVKINLWNRSVETIRSIIAENKIYCKGVVEGTAEINKISTNIRDVISDIIFVTTPSTAHKEIAREIAPFVHENMVILLNPGRCFGAIEFAEELKKQGITKMPYIGETQSIVYTCRKSDPNHAVIFALKRNVSLAVLGGDGNYDYVYRRIPDCLQPYFQKADSIAETSLNNVGMILHCAPVLMNIGWIESDKVDFKYYYDGISPSIAGFLEKMDRERIAVAAKMGVCAESVKDWLKRTYGVTGNTLYECLRNNKTYREIDAPKSLTTRYLFEDIPNGLVSVEYLGSFFKDAGTPAITLIINLANEILNYDFRREGRRFSLETIEKYL